MQDNAEVGAQYLEWLTVYFGHFYFGINDFAATDLTTVSGPVGTGGVTLTLLDVVLAAYNVGPGAVEDLHGTADGSDDTLSIPNPQYVASVHQNLDSSCPCQS
jgi:hypothetical protein